MITLPKSRRSRMGRYTLLHVHDNRAQFALRWLDHRDAAKQPVEPPLRWLVEVLLIIHVIAVVVMIYYVAKDSAAKFNPKPTPAHYER